MSSVLPTPRRARAARAQLALAMLLAGSSVVLSKVVAAHVPVFLANTLILLPTCAALLLVARRVEGPLKVPRGAWGPLALQALFGVVLFRALLFYGVPLTSAASAGILTSAVPAVTALLAWPILRERPNRRGAAGVLLTVLGVLALTVPGANAGGGNRPLLGAALVLGAVVGEALWNVLSRVSGARLGPFTATALVTAFALAMFLPAGLAQARSFDFSGLTPADGLAMLYYGLFATACAYTLWFAGVRFVTASAAAVYTGWLPVSAVALSALVLHEPLTVWHGVGLACVVVATLVFARPT